MPGESILVIDSDTNTTHQIISILESEDYLVFTASSGDVGLAMVEKVNPSLIFINHAMADASALEICEKIHGTEHGKNVPVVVISSVEIPLEPRHTDLYGIVDSLKKPFSPEDLILKTRRILSRSVDVMSIPEKGTEVVKSEECRTPEEVSGKEAEASDLSDETAEKIREITEPSDENMTKQTGVRIEEEKTDYLKNFHEKFEKEVRKEHEAAYALKRSVRRRGRKRRLPLTVIIIVLVILTGGGIMLYKELWQKTEVQAPRVVEPPRVVEQQADKVAPLLEQPSPQPAQVHEAPAKSESKPASREMYSVQIGAFKNENNASSMTEQYKEKGYEAFTHKSTLTSKEVLYRVLIGRFEDRKEAAKMAKEISASENIRVTIFKE